MQFLYVQPRPARARSIYREAALCSTCSRRQAIATHLVATTTAKRGYSTPYGEHIPTLHSIHLQDDREHVILYRGESAEEEDVQYLHNHVVSSYYYYL